MSLMTKAKTQEEAEAAFFDLFHEPCKGEPGQPDDYLEALHKHALDYPVIRFHTIHRTQPAVTALHKSCRFCRRRLSPRLGSACAAALQHQRMRPAARTVACCGSSSNAFAHRNSSVGRRRPSSPSHISAALLTVGVRRRRRRGQNTRKRRVGSGRAGSNADGPQRRGLEPRLPDGPAESGPGPSQMERLLGGSRAACCAPGRFDDPGRKSGPT
jgi:hypothetical protein